MKLSRFLSKCYWKLAALTVYKWSFRHFGRKSRIDRPLRLDGCRNISIGDNVWVQPGTWLGCTPETGCEKPELCIGNGTVLGNYNHIYATRSIVIEENVLTADKVYVSDNLHSYENPDISVIKQPVKQVSDVVIGAGSWLGENVCVIGAKVGKHCVIGANAVVTKDIPDYSVAVGVPAKVVKRYDFEAKSWVKVD